ncbi:unnamed protein product [Spirodela intermedia]|uniref:Glycosyltransferase family 92 protein n=1 Tax=Spirodela intermedia TaxID=51605 RepID=A0A7I8K3Y9_SPIIN|nr:unnamed protein product [Spirodela intermedia]
MERKRRLKPLSKAAVTSGVLAVVFISLLGYLAFDPLRDGRGDGIGGGGGGGGGFSSFHGQHHHHSAVVERQDGFELRPLPPLSASPTPPMAGDAVLFPDWEAYVLLSPGELPPLPSDRPLCVFQNGATSPANFSGVLPYSRHRAAFRCPIPRNVQRLRRLLIPRVVIPPADGGGALVAPPQLPDAREFVRWNFVVYESLSTGEDVIVFAKGVNPRHGNFDRPVEDLRCVFVVSSAAVRTPVTSSSQEVFRCPHPDDAQLEALMAASAKLGEGVRISLEIRDHRGAVPSLAEYRPPPATEEEEEEEEAKEESLLCACTMVFNVAKFLREWVVYHSRIGVDRFFLYDNGSEDDLGEVIAGLQRRGYNVSSLPWPWPKTQEAGFSHCAAAARRRCRWMMYLDVDEFAFSPSWSKVPLPSPAMLKSILPPSNGGSSGRRVGQLSMDCYDFGPSNRTTHPENGVTQGYTCRRRAGERHKSIVRLQAVDPSLRNVIHHFKLRDGYVAGKPPARVVVNHYKYQAWPEFRAKFRRRASAYVADWTDATNPLSKDRTPGLGFAAVEPPDWAGRFCEVPDGRLRELVRRWFGRGEDAGSTGDRQMEWETFR